jgi:hypothetical protein
VTDYYKFSDEIPDMQLIVRLLTGQPDAEQLAAIISRSYDYIQNLPLRGIDERYPKDNPLLYDTLP